MRSTRTGPFGLVLPAAILALSVVGHAQTAEWTVLVNGSPVALSRPVVRSGTDLLIPIAPVARALGFQLEPAPEIRGLRVRRSAGATVEYDGRNGEIRFGPVVAGQLRNYTQLTLSGPLEELLFPVDGLIPLLAVDVQFDPGENALHINSSGDSLSIPSAGRLGVASLDYSLGITRAGDSNGHYTTLRSDALAGGIPLTSSFLLAGSGASVGLQHGSVTGDLARSRTFTAGDQTAISGIDALTSSVRGGGYSAPFRMFQASVYAGRTARTVRALSGAPGVADYDSTIVGGAMRRRSLESDLSFAANSFTGPGRKGTSIGTAFVKTTERNQVRAQVVAGAFSGFSFRTMSPTIVTDLQAPPDPAADPTPSPEKVHVRGGALGFSLLDTYKPNGYLTITAQLDRYSRNFLAAREDSEYHAQSMQRLSMTLRPLPAMNLYGGLMRRRYLVGNGGIRSFNYGATGSISAIPWMQMGYFRLVQNDKASHSGRLELTQYSATLVNLLQYSGSFMFSDLHFNNTAAHTINATVGRDFSSYGHLSVHDQLQLNTLHRYGAEWQFDIPRGSLRLGLDRWASLQTADRAYVPVFGLVLKLRGMQRLVATYSGERGTHMLSIVMSGPVFRRENLRRDNDGRVSITTESSLEGRVYLDTDDDGVFDPGSDIGMHGIAVWLDAQTSMVTDAAGTYRFDRMKPGTHALRADLADVPADMVFADSGDRRVAVLPFRNNVQNFAVVRTGLLSGKVTYLDYSEDPEKPIERPLAEARIIADSEHDTYSDVDGNITIGSLAPGTYRLRVDPESIPEGYVARVEPEEARVTAGEMLRGVHIQLMLAPRPVLIRDLPKQQALSPR